MEWITIQEAISLTKVSDSTIRRWIKQKRIIFQYSPALRRYRINKQSLLEYIEYGDSNETTY